MDGNSEQDVGVEEERKEVEGETKEEEGEIEGDFNGSAVVSTTPSSAPPTETTQIQEGNSPRSPFPKEGPEKVRIEQKNSPKVPQQPPSNASPMGADEGGKERRERERRKFRMLGLEMETSFEHPLIRKLMRAAQSFHLWFDRGPFETDLATKKRGGISFTFDTEPQAKAAFDEVKNLDIDGCRIKFQAPRDFIESHCEVPEIASPDPAIVMPEQEAPAEDPNADPVAEWEVILADVKEREPAIQRKLHLSQLLPSAKPDLLETLFDKEDLEDVQMSIDPKKNDKSKVAVVTFLSEEAAKSGIEEFNGFQIDDGEVTRCLRIVPYLEYLKEQHFSKYPGYLASLAVKNAESKSSLSEGIEGTEQNLNSSSPPDDIESRREDIQESSNGNTWPPVDQLKTESPFNHPSPAQPSSSGSRISAPASTEGAKMTVDKIRYQIRQLIEEKRINWAELNETQELWSLLDQVCERVGWIPEQNLQRAMLLTLEFDLNNTEPSWMRNHLTELIRGWKKEISREARSNRSGREFVMVAPDYRPPLTSPPKKKFKNKEHRKQVMGLMGVGALLASVKEQAQGEEGELEEGDTGAGAAERTLPQPPRAEANSPPALKSPTKKKRRQKESNRPKAYPEPEIVEKPQKRKKTKKNKPEKEKKAKKSKQETEKPQDELEEGEVNSGSDEEAEPGAAYAMGSDSDSSGAEEKTAADNASSSSSSSSGSSSSESSSSEEDDDGSSDGSGSKSAKNKKSDKGKKKQSKSRKKRRKERESMRKAAEEQLRQQYKAAKKKQKKQEELPEGVPPGMAKMMSALGGGGMESGEMMKKMQSMMPMMPQMMGMFQQMMASRMGGGGADPAQRQQQMMQMFKQFQQQFAMMGGQVPGTAAAAPPQQAAHPEGQQPWMQQQPPPAHHPYYAAQPPGPYGHPPPTASGYPQPVRPAMYPPPYYTTPNPAQPPPR